MGVAADRIVPPAGVTDHWVAGAQMRETGLATGRSTDEREATGDKQINTCGRFDNHSTLTMLTWHDTR